MSTTTGRRSRTAHRAKQSQILEAQGDAISTVLRAKSAESMGERAIIDRGMDALESIGQGESTTFIIPQELTSLLGRYGKGLTGSDVATNSNHLESLEFDTETRELIGLDDIGEILGEIDEAAGSMLRISNSRPGRSRTEIRALSPPRRPVTNPTTASGKRRPTRSSGRGAWRPRQVRQPIFDSDRAVRMDPAEQISEADATGERRGLAFPEHGSEGKFDISVCDV